MNPKSFAAQYTHGEALFRAEKFIEASQAFERAVKISPKEVSAKRRQAQALQKAHMDNIGKMAEAGKLVLAGPFMDDGELRGIYIFNVPTLEEAKALTETDPAIQAGSLVLELHPWYGSAALMKVNEWHGKLAKEEI